ncbi:MAG: DUF2029 domain-containing protein [Symploca sp. SIO2D2]|nr:DUF2029 domain-containing protein [Symploca sp. SIO2D2]
MSRQQIASAGSLSVAAISIAASLWMERIDWTQSPILPLGTLTIIQYSLLALCMVGYWNAGPKTNNWKDYRALLAVAIVARLALIPINPYTSNDIDRYLFDGKVALSGYDPYRLNHNDPLLSQLRQEWATPEEHAKYPTLYPPGALGLFASAAASGPQFAEISWKIMSALAGIAFLLVMVCLLKRVNKLRHLSLVALSPLLIFETGVGAHVDIFSALAIAVALLFWQQDKLAHTGIALGVGALIKLVPALLLVPLCFGQSSFKRFFTIGLPAMLMIITGYSVAFALGMHPIGSTPVFFEKWRNAAPVFDVLNTYIKDKDLLYLIIAILIFTLCLIAYKSWRIQANKTRETIKYMQISIAIPLLLSPVVFPWYLLPLAPLFALQPNAFLAAWFVLLPFTYEVLNQFACCDNWAPQQWPVTLLAIGLAAGFSIDRWLFYKRTQCLKKGYA